MTPSVMIFRSWRGDPSATAYLTKIAPDLDLPDLSETNSVLAVRPTSPADCIAASLTVESQRLAGLLDALRAARANPLASATISHFSFNLKVCKSL